MHRKILIISDIEGSTGCLSARHSAYKTPEWASACYSLTQDMNAAAGALFEAGAESVTVVDFHRTGYNIFPVLLDKRLSLRQGYRAGPVIGIGNAEGFDAAFFMGMHAASGTQGFIPHTLTSRFSRILVNGRPLAEIELFASSLAQSGVKPVFFSGCPAAVKQAYAVIPGIAAFSVDKSLPGYSPDAVRKELAASLPAALYNDVPPYNPAGSFTCRVRMRDGAQAALKLARRWGLKQEGDEVVFESKDMPGVYFTLARCAWLIPAAVPVLPAALFLSNLLGRAALTWALKQQGQALSAKTPGATL